MGKKTILRKMTGVTVFVMSMLLLLSSSGLEARSGFGPKGAAMGGAGVASVDDQMAPSWNPANLGARPGFQVGLHGSVGYETTRNFADDIDATLDVFDDFEGDFGDEDYYAAILENSDQIKRLMEGDDAGLIGGDGGANLSIGNFGLGFNSYAELTGFWDGSAQSLFRTALDDLNKDEMRKLVNNLSYRDELDEVDFDREPTNPAYRDAATKIKADIDRALGDDTLEDLFGYDPDVTTEQIANSIAARVEEMEDKHPKISPRNLERFSSNFMGDIIGLARDITGGSGASISSSTILSGDDTDAPRVAVEGLWINELSLSYALREPLYATEFGQLYAGGSLKYMQGTVGSAACVLDEDDCDITWDDNTNESSDFGIDLGLRYEIPDYALRFGLVGKNLNSPSFSYPDGESIIERHRGADIELKPSYRAGLEFRPLYLMPTEALGREWWGMSLDYDVSAVETVFESYERQYLAVGNEFNPDWFLANLALRAGFRDNLAESDAPRIWTLGAGVRLAGATVDLAVEFSDDDVEVDGDSMPTMLGASLGLSFQF